MAITIDWGNKIIHVPRADMGLVQSIPTEIRTLDTDWFRQQLKNLEDTVEGISFPDTHRHIAGVTVGGVQLARVVEIINGYSITFEDGQYAVNLASSNNNIADKTNVNQVSVRSANSAGLITVAIGSGVTAQDKQDIVSLVWGKAPSEMSVGGIGEWLYKKALTVPKFLGLK